MLIVYTNAFLPADKLPAVLAAIEEAKGRTYKTPEIAVGLLGFDVDYDEDYNLTFNPIFDEQNDHDFIEGLPLLAPFLDDGTEFLLHCFFDCDEAAFRRFIVKGDEVIEYSGSLEWEEIDEDKDDEETLRVLSRGYF